MWCGKNSCHDTLQYTIPVDWILWREWETYQDRDGRLCMFWYPTLFYWCTYSPAANWAGSYYLCVEKPRARLCYLRTAKKNQVFSFVFYIWASDFGWSKWQGTAWLSSKAHGRKRIYSWCNFTCSGKFTIWSSSKLIRSEKSRILLLTLSVDDLFSTEYYLIFSFWVRVGSSDASWSLEECWI